MGTAAGDYVKVTSDYTASNAGDISLYQNDIVKVISVVGDDWYEGELGGSTGLFPASCCRPLIFENRSLPFGVAVFDHEAHLDDELSFLAGDQIFLTSQINSEWFEGRCRNSRGMFPASFIEVVNEIPPERSEAPVDSQKRRPPPLDQGSLERLRTKSFTLRTKSASPEPVLTRSKTMSNSSLTPPPRNRTPSRQSGRSPVAKSPPARPPTLAPAFEPPPPTSLEDYRSLENTRRSRAPDRAAPARPRSLVEGKQLPLPDPPPARPPALKTEAVVKLREKKADKSPQRPPSTYVISPPVVNLSTLPDQEAPAEQTGSVEGMSSTTSGSQEGEEGDSGGSFQRRTFIGQEPVAVAVGGEDVMREEVEYANEDDILAITKEYKTSAREDAEVEKIRKAIATKEGILRTEVEAKRDTEDLLGKQFSGKKINSENVEVLRSLLQAHSEKITELQTAIDKLNAKLRNVKSPQKTDKLEGIERRDKVLLELIETEESYVHHLQLLIQGFVTPLRNNKGHSMEVDLLFLNVEAIVALSEKLLMMLRGQTSLMSHEQMIGRCFTHLEAELHKEYTFYLVNQASVLNLIKGYEEDKTHKELLMTCLAKIREETSCWDLQSFLIKPVQRIMKYPLLLRDMLNSTPTHWTDRPNIVSALETVDSIMVFANESKRKDELLRRYNTEVGEGSLLPKMSLHGLRKKGKRFTTTLTHSLHITSAVVTDSQFSEIAEQFSTLDTIVKTLLRESASFTDLLKKVLNEMEHLCKCIHNFYDNLEEQKNVFLYHGSALKITQNVTPRFIKDLEEGPLATLSELQSFFNAPQYLLEKRSSKKLDYDSLAQQISETGMVTEGYKIARGEFEALNEQLMEDLPILIHEGAEVVKKSSYSVLALFCQYAQSCHDELHSALEKMSIQDTSEVLSYHTERMKECCATLLTISSFEKDVTQAIVLGGTLKSSKSFDQSDAERKLSDSSATDVVSKWLEATSVNSADTQSEEEEEGREEAREEEEEEEEVFFEKPGIIEGVRKGTHCIVLYQFTATDEGMLSVRPEEMVTVVTDCNTADTWAYVKRGEERGYIPKTYISLPKSQKNKPAPLPPSKKTKRKAPAPPSRSMSESALMQHSRPTPTRASTQATLAAPAPAAAPATSPASSGLVPRRSAPPPPATRQKSAPSLPLPVLARSRSPSPLPPIEEPVIFSSASSVDEEFEDAVELLLNLSSNLGDRDNLPQDSLPQDSLHQPSLHQDSFSSHLYEEIPEPLSPENAYENLPPTGEGDGDATLRADATLTAQPGYSNLPPPCLESTVETGMEELCNLESGSIELESETGDTEGSMSTASEPVESESAATESTESGGLASSELIKPSPVPVPIPVKTPPASIVSENPAPSADNSDEPSQVDLSEEPTAGRVLPSPAPFPSSLSSQSLSSISSLPPTPCSPVPTAPKKKQASSGMFDECPTEDFGGGRMGSQYSTVNKIKKYEAQFNYRARSPAELSLNAKQLVQVIDTTNKEWWYVKIGIAQGYVPADYLKLFD